MRIGIITFHRAINYGACLQAYALKQALLDLNVQAEVIDYRSKMMEKSYYSPIHTWEPIKTNIKNILTWKVQNKRNQVFAPFFNDYISSEKNKIISDPSKLSTLNNEFDAFISGSDQVWNLRCSYGDLAYLLDFVDNKKKKYSYAASFGYFKKEDFENETYKRLISDFAFRSVRETTGIEIVTKLLDGKCENTAQHIDPTFLLGLEKWKKLLRPIDYGEKYVLVYSLTMPPKMIELAEKISRHYGLKLKIITLNNLYTLQSKYDVIIASPEEFLSYMFSAEYVLTNSFHGTAFSIIFNKKFRILLNRNPQHDNGRLLDLLKVVGINSSIVNDNLDDLNFYPVDYCHVNKNVSDLRQEALKYLKWVLGEIDETYIRKA